MHATPLRKKVLLCLILSLLASKAAADVAIARRGKAAAKVVVAGDASETEKQAAGELAFFLHIVTGGEFPIVQEAVGDGGRLLAGEGAVRLADPSFNAGGLGKEEIIVRTAGSDLILAGGSPRATLYAVYTFLEDVVGCRWWTSTASAMPWKRTLKIKPIAIRYAPPLEYREPFWFVAFDPIWDARNKVNGTRAGGDDLRGGKIECSFSQPLNGERNKAFFEDLKGWSNIADRLFIWDYTTNFAHYIQPHPNYQVLGPNIRVFVEHKVSGIFEQGAYQSTGAEMAEFRAWLLAKLLWNPSLDPETLRREFLRGYYGPAAGYVSDYMILLERAVQASGDHMGCYSPPDAKFLSLDTILRAWAILKKAENRVRGTLEYARRVRSVQMPMAYAVLVRWDDLQKETGERNLAWPWPRARNEWLAWFLQAARAEKVGMISEWQTLDDWAGKGGKSR
jgi:hypothetical protein